MANVEHSKLMAQLKQKTKGAWTRARKVEPKARGAGGFPPNLKNLVAKVTEYKFAKTTMKDGKGGDPYFSLSAIVVEPAEYAGRRAAFNWFLNESQYQTLEESLENFANDLALMQGGTTNYQDGPPDDVADAPAFLQELIDNEAHIIFNSGGPRKNGNAPNLFIQGLAEGYTNGEQSADEPDSENPEEGTEEETGDGEGEAAEADEEESADDEGAEETAEEGTSDEWQPVVGDAYSVAIGKDKPANCEVASDQLRDDGKLKVKMTDGPNTGKSYFVSPENLQEYIEPKKAPAKKPEKKTAKKTSKKK